MTNKRICEILNNKTIQEIYYNEQPVWFKKFMAIRATVGFLNSSDTMDLYIDDLYEKNLYN